MSRRWVVLVIAGCLLASLLYGQRRFRSFDDDEDNPTAIPADANEKTEFLFSRLKYPTFRGGYYYRRSSWATDYPKADRQFLQGLRRLTRIHARSVENVVDLDSNEIYNYPWIYAVEVGHWGLSEPQAKKLRDYLDRGGFLMVDDFHGTFEWDVFYDSLRRVYPDRPVVEVENQDQLHHIIYDIDSKVQVPGIHTYFDGSTYERDGLRPVWRAVFDEKGRATVAICHNMDLGDAWEWADHPQYPEQYAAVAYRVAVNYIIYSMTH